MYDFEEQAIDTGFELSTWKKLLKLMKNQKKLFIFAIFTFIGIAIVETAFPLLTMYAIDTFIIAGDLSTLPVFIWVYCAIVVAQGMFIFGLIEIGGRLETSIVYEIRKAAFKRLQELSYPFYDNTPIGYIMARMTADSQRIGDTITWGGLDILWSTTVIIVALSIMVFVNPFLTLISIAVMPVLVIATIYFRKKMLKNHRDIRKQNSKITAAFAEGINSARTTKTLVREEKNYEEFDDLTEGMVKLSVRAATLSAAFWPIVISISNIGIGLVLWHGGQAALLEAISFGTLSMFIGYTFMMFEPIQNIARLFSDIQSAQASAERTIGLIETDLDISDSKEAIEKYGSLLDPKPENWPLINGEITFVNVDFKYKTGEEVLRDFNLHVKAGEKIALVGETGSGKSTIINLICRFYEPTSGKVLIDGVDYREYSQIWLQSNLGYVLQAPHLFSGTIMENIRYGNLNATDEEVMEAAKIVNAYDFIMKTEKGFDSEVGEGGAKLSTGEKQLISFARAILKNPRIFVLDEATSSIDTVTEQIIQKAIDHTLQGRTSFIVAHRLSTIRSADRILVIQNGKITESGSHRQLLKAKGYYHKLYTNQFKQEAEEKILQGG